MRQIDLSSDDTSESRLTAEVRLFRPEALRNASERTALRDQVIQLGIPGLSLALGGVISVVVLVAAVFLSLTSFARAEDVRGWIVPKGGLVRISARADGVVSRASTVVGATVAAGSPLIELRTSDDTTVGDATTAALIQIDTESQSSETEAAADERTLLRQRDSLRAALALYDQRLAENRHRTALAQERKTLADANLARTKQLMSGGFLSEAAVENARRNALDTEEALSQTREATYQILDQKRLAQAELAQLPDQIASQRARAQGRSAQLDQKRIVTLAQGRNIANAPVDAKVLALPLKPGASVQAGETLAVLSPLRDQLIVELYATSASAPFLRRGQTAQLKLDGYPYQKFGSVPAEVLDVSDAPLMPAEVKWPALTGSAPVYLVRLRLPDPTIQLYGRRTPLQAGMPLTATITLERRSLFEWLFEPLYAAGRR